MRPSVGTRRSARYERSPASSVTAGDGIGSAAPRGRQPAATGVPWRPCRASTPAASGSSRPASRAPTGSPSRPQSGRPSSSRLGHTCFWFAGEVDRAPERSREVPEAFYRHPEIEAINAEVYAASREVTAAADAEHPLVRRRDFFSPYVRPPHVTRRIDELKGALKGSLYDFLRDFDLDLLVVENALAIPLNLPLGLALAEVVAETGIPVLAHHHDFAWERQRFAANSVADLIAAAFPPPVAVRSARGHQLGPGPAARLADGARGARDPQRDGLRHAAPGRSTTGRAAPGPTWASARGGARPAADADRPAQGDRARHRADPAPRDPGDAGDLARERGRGRRVRAAGAGVRPPARRPRPVRGRPGQRGARDRRRTDGGATSSPTSTRTRTWSPTARASRGSGTRSWRRSTSGVRSS